ncbi:ectonucleoside triphosphate diphosphohydrolase 2-like [Erpetoichthys calabaricus]|uniref:ectonucleoside triphosphate diphosphohydrolase 2-like n=1 Tax=Erpetoichthys calabaricus TaxID=27687 RepID=UPI002234342B|nr:ectonucleoside triphosphate diphosphohydrolase 2-like [Erpetoichthys calabaricus]
MAVKAAALAVPTVLLLASLLGIILLAVPTRDALDPPGSQYGIVLDAGSSHTTMFIYKWPSDKENNTGIVSQHGECHADGYGISSYTDDPSRAGLSLKKCLDEALLSIPKAQHRETPIYLGATAGMRLLKMTSLVASDQILQAVETTIRAYPFDFRGAKILSGREEGVFGWVTVNYLLENFIKYGWVGRWVNPRKETVGALDLGGASTQITFVTKESIEDQEDEMRLQLYGQEYKVYTHSFLCYGRDQVLRRVLSRLLKENGYAKSIIHPCWPSDFSKNVTLRAIYESPCTEKEKPPDYQPDDSVQLTGSGSGPGCKSIVSQLFDFRNCPFSSCSLDGIFQPRVTGDFMAFAAFFYTHSFLRRTTGITVSSPADLRRAASATCTMKFSEMFQKAPELQNWIQDYCTVSIFIDLLLTQAYKFDNASFSHISFQKKAGDTSIGWALGYMLNLSNMIPAESLSWRKSTQYSAWALVMVLLVLVLLCAIVLIVQKFRGSRKSDSVI